MKKAGNPNHNLGSPHMTQAEVNAFVASMLRKEFGQRAELITMLSRTLQKTMADMPVDKSNSSESKK